MMKCKMVASELPPLGVTPRFADLEYIAPFTEERLDAWRAVGDPLADAIVARLAAEGPLKQIHDLLGVVRRRAAAGDAECQGLLDEGRRVPAWADFAAMKKGQRLLASYVPFMAASLFSGSLVGGAMFYKAAIVTSMTGMLSGNPLQRLTETTAMVMRMAFPHTIEPGGEAHEVLLRVRLLHAGLRRFLVDSGRFRHEREVPINQQDLAITLALFGYVNIRNLIQLGVVLRRDEIDSFVLLWRYAGHVLGIDDALLPRTVEEQQAFYLSSCKHQARPDKVFPETKKLLDAVAKKSVLPFSMSQTFLHQVTRYLAGNDYITGMQIEDKGDYYGLKLFRACGRASSLAHRLLPFAESIMYAFGAGVYRRELRKNERRRAYAYRVRTHDAAPRAESAA
jgi:hypothetical protein